METEVKKHNTKYGFNRRNHECDTNNWRMNNEKKIQSYGFLIFNNNKTRVLLVKGRIGEKWGPPKGHIEDYDNSPFHTATRETLQETGLIIDTTIRYKYIYAGTTQLFIIVLKEPYIPVVQDTNEIIDCKWIDIKDLCMYELNMPMKDLIRTKKLKVF